MNLKKDIDLLVHHIKSLKDFKLVNPDPPMPYMNMGATITDAILQAGTNYSTVVKPRVVALIKREEANTTSGFRGLLLREGTRSVLEWKDAEKPKRILELTDLFINEGVENELILKTWMQDDRNIAKLQSINGVGNKTIDYLKILTGISTAAVDRHLLNFIRYAKIDIQNSEYGRARSIITETAKQVQVSSSTLDHSIWSYMSRRSSQEKKERLPTKKRELSRFCQKALRCPRSIDFKPSDKAIKIGPYHSNEMVLCSADASPQAQRKRPDQAQDFYPGGKWVGAIRNTAARLSCDFLILTTQYGLVEPHLTITPYDLHINEHRQEVTEKWMATIPPLMHGARYRLMVFYAGGCPRDEMIEVALPILKQHGVALLTFGRPNMFDVGKVEPIWGMLMKGTTDEEIKSTLKVPERFRYYPANDQT